MNYLSEADWLSKPHQLSKASNSLSGWETLEEDKSEICLLSRSARPSSLSEFSLTLAQWNMLAERVFVCWEVQEPLKHWDWQKTRGHHHNHSLAKHLLCEKTERNRTERLEKTFSLIFFHFLSPKIFLSLFVWSFSCNGRLELLCWGVTTENSWSNVLTIYLMLFSGVLCFYLHLLYMLVAWSPICMFS